MLVLLPLKLGKKRGVLSVDARAPMVQRPAAKLGLMPATCYRRQSCIGSLRVHQATSTITSFIVVVVVAAIVVVAVTYVVAEVVAVDVVVAAAAAAVAVAANFADVVVVSAASTNTNTNAYDACDA